MSKHRRIERGFSHERGQRCGDRAAQNRIFRAKMGLSTIRERNFGDAQRDIPASDFHRAASTHRRVFARPDHEHRLTAFDGVTRPKLSSVLAGPRNHELVLVERKHRKSRTGTKPAQGGSKAGLCICNMKGICKRASFLAKRWNEFSKEPGSWKKAER